MAKPFKSDSWFRYPTFHWTKKHAVIVGAGIAGCQIAWHLVKQGWQVTLIEREARLAQQASGNPAGIISPKMTARPSSGESFYVDCFHYAIEQLKQLKQQHQQLDWHPCGLLQLAHNEREQQRWEALKDRKFARHFLQLLDKTQSSEIAGIPIEYKASYFPQAGWINPVNYCEVLIKDCEDKCQLIVDTDVITLVNNKNNWELHGQDQQIIASAEAVIITTGKDLNQFPHTNQLPSMPVAGQTTVASSNTFTDQLNTTIGHQGYLTPVSELTSKLSFGASFERNIDAAKLNPESDKKNLQQLRKYIPQLADSLTKIESAHTAIRLTTPDRYPYLGGIADSVFYAENYSDLHQGKQYKQYPIAQYIDGLFVLAGLGSRGLTTSGLCAKILTNILHSKQSKKYNRIQKNCHPARFIIKDLKRNKLE